jgi:O-antigen/teichoic acid export membrane protein
MPQLPVEAIACESTALRLELPANRLSSRLVALARRAVLAVSDQALFSGANFVLSILLARWLSTAEYGAYSLAYAVFLLFSSMHGALLIEPAMIFGPGRYMTEFPRYSRLLMRAHFAVTVPASLVLLASSGWLGQLYSRPVGTAMVGLALASPFILMFWVFRRVPYIVMQPWWAVAASGCYMLLLLGTAAVLYAEGWLTTVSAYLAMGATSFGASLLPWFRFARKPKGMDGLTAGETLTFSTVVRDHTRYGRWAVGSAAVAWLPGQVYYALLPALMGLEGAAGLRALMNLIMPVLQAISALTMVLLPILVRDRGTSVAKMKHTMMTFLCLFCGGALVYLAGLWFAQGQVFALFYGGKYSEYGGWPLLITGLLPLGTCFSSVLGNVLRAMERPDLMLWCSVGSVFGAVLVGLPLSAKYGVIGALCGLLVSSCVTILMQIGYYRKVCGGAL